MHLWWKSSEGSKETLFPPSQFLHKVPDPPSPPLEFLVIGQKINAGDFLALSYSSYFVGSWGKNGLRSLLSSFLQRRKSNFGLSWLESVLFRFSSDWRSVVRETVCPTLTRRKKKETKTPILYSPGTLQRNNAAASAYLVEKPHKRRIEIIHCLPNVLSADRETAQLLFFDRSPCVWSAEYTYARNISEN